MLALIVDNGRNMKDYPGVMKASGNPAALEVVWNIPISQDEALKVIFAYLDEHEATPRFTAETMRGKAWSNGDMRLPIKPTLGIVLHEVAHVLAWCDNGQSDHHGPAFVKILDGLVRSEMIDRGLQTLH